MSQVGRIIKIAGPLVVAKGIQGVRMYEVCKVGNEELIGEVNRVEEDMSFIQVYEETAGIRPGEKVAATGTSLSLELGPGLLGQLFDGIQRPLPAIMEASGDFIRRGILVSALSKDKKWQFTPKVNNGDKVQAGDILGVVPETTLVEHRIMVPPGVTGEIANIASEGEYTVLETIAKVKTNGGKVREIPMMQEWPVRAARPYKEKVPTEVPLITGQRIVDTFFPVAKGGTSAIPGGFGTGKCVTGDTPVLLATGDTTPIQSIYEESLQYDGYVLKDSENETLIQLKKPILILSFDGVSYVPREATHIYRGRTGETVKITTRTQRSAKVTPVHKLFRFNGEAIEEVEAQKLRVGDYLIVPRKLDISGETTRFDPYEIDLSLRVVDPQAIQQMLQLIRNLKKHMTLKTLAKRLNVSYDVLIGYWKEKNNPTLGFLDKLTRIAGVPRISVELVKAERHSEPFIIPSCLTKELAEWLGLFVADGHIKGAYGGIYLYNTDEQILERFKELSLIVFDSEVEFGQDASDRTPFAYIRNATLKKFLYHLGIPDTDKTYNIRIPSCIRTAPEDYLVHFLGGYFAGDGWFSRYTVGFSTASLSLYSDLGYLLTRFGVLYRTRMKDESYVIELDGRSAEHLSEIFFLHGVYQYSKLQPLFEYAKQSVKHFAGLDVVPIGQQLLIRLQSQGKNSQGQDIFRKTSGIRLRNYTKQGETPSLGTVRLITEILDTHETRIDPEILKKLQDITKASEHIYFDRIAKIEIEEEDIPVFDITVDETHNFVGGILPFTLHNTVMLHQLAAWADSNIIVYVGCGERGNEMTEVLEKFPTYKDPRSGEPLMNRTVLIANTSNMPVAAREASIYTGITMAEYFRDMGYDIALQADSTSRWAEALREISGRLEEMPGEEGYPAYLASRLAEFYERAGRVKTLGTEPRMGSVSVTGAVSPPGGDFSEPVTQGTLRIIKTFWGLDTDLAYRRHFPAINWLTSYSLYLENLQEWYNRIGKRWNELREEAMAILEKEEELTEIVQLVGPDALPESERVMLESARIIREDYLQQSALHPIDTFCPMEKMYRMLEIILKLHHSMRRSIDRGVSIKDILELPVIERIARMKIVPYEDRKKMQQTFNEIEKEVDNQFSELVSKSAI
ncbi:MAG: V-type ATP synthase subunit A [Promethearchaeota archaeon]